MERKVISNGLGTSLQSTLPKPLAKLIQPLLFAILGISKIDKIYNGACKLNIDKNFAEKLLHKDVMNIRLDISETELKKIPTVGPLIVVANHPYGAIDGIALLALLKRVRPDVKLMANYILGGIPELKEHFFLVDPFGNQDSSRNSFGGVREALKWVRAGHVLGVFPAGEVSAWCKDRKTVIDKDWPEGVGMIIKSGKCPVQCVFFEGKNSRLFQLLGRIKPVLRTLWLARECDRSCNNILKIRIGSVISSEKCKGFKPAAKLMNFLKSATYALHKKVK
ncbi:lysophospholipid acyltransferase family protein [Lentisphaerota bacterium ZTH]|nr:lysophospholipid acyltransferase family protein [Lentisphaerota bacterium]WET07100.1 lysophospholipid acyltransferase family protein [Lentisphaerota bacterium ZTH]